jgi:hypothetical protein
MRAALAPTPMRAFELITNVHLNALAAINLARTPTRAAPTTTVPPIKSSFP